MEKKWVSLKTKVYYVLGYFKQYKYKMIIILKSFEVYDLTVPHEIIFAQYKLILDVTRGMMVVISHRLFTM